MGSEIKKEKEEEGEGADLDSGEIDVVFRTKGSANLAAFQLGDLGPFSEV